ncbi:GntR family transcriptional regulator, partial [Candidatus Berkelbacteria bacterium]|nr:GntR family transcriptional regulator [Candidatus Berkelbacteria bacterium]
MPSRIAAKVNSLPADGHGSGRLLNDVAIPNSSAAEHVSTLARISKLPLYLQVSQWLEDKIASGHYKPGARLPGDNELAQQFGVSIITVRAAMRVLIEKQ